MKVGIFNKADGTLASSYEADAPAQGNYGGPWGDPSQFAHMEIPSAMHIRAVSLGMSQEKWVKEGQADELSQPMIDDGEGNMIPDVSYTHVPSVEEIQEDSALRTAALAEDASNNVKAAVGRAMGFGQQLMTEFAAENVMLGITADGQTGAVLDKMGPTMAAIQSGSLYEAITRAKAIPQASYDAKYVTEARLISFINKIETYLGVTPLTTDIYA